MSSWSVLKILVCWFKIISNLLFLIYIIMAPGNEKMGDDFCEGCSQNVDDVALEDQVCKGCPEDGHGSHEVIGFAGAIGDAIESAENESAGEDEAEETSSYFLSRFHEMLLAAGKQIKKDVASEKQAAQDRLAGSPDKVLSPEDQEALLGELCESYEVLLGRQADVALAIIKGDKNLAELGQQIIAEKDNGRCRQLEAHRDYVSHYVDGLRGHYKMLSSTKVEDVRKTLEAYPSLLWSVNELKKTGGEPVIFFLGEIPYVNGGGIFIQDGVVNLPAERCNVAFDKSGEEYLRMRDEQERQFDSECEKLVINGNVKDMAKKLEVDIPTQFQYLYLMQNTQPVDLETDSWLRSDPSGGRFLRPVKEGGFTTEAVMYPLMGTCSNSVDEYGKPIPDVVSSNSEHCSEKLGARFVVRFPWVKEDEA